MILRRPDAILDVTTKSPRSDLAEPFGMVEKGEVLLDLNVTEVVPVTDLGRIELVQQRRQLALARNLLITTAAFDSEFYFFCRGVLDDSFQAIFHSFQMRGRCCFPFFHGPNFLPNIFPGKKFAFSSELDE